MAIRDLTCHPSTFVTVDELAQYWSLSRRQVRKHIQSGTLEAMVLGPRLYRIRTAAALEFELMLKTQTASLARRAQAR
jgi:excisionase family DNA binding protein